MFIFILRLYINKYLGEIPRSPTVTESQLRKGPAGSISAQGRPSGFARAARPPLPATVNHHSDQVVHAVQVHGVTGGVEEPEFQREDHPVRELGVPVELFHVLEPL